MFVFAIPSTGLIEYKRIEMKKKKAFRLGNFYGLLESGPVVLVTTHYKDKINVMPLSWLMMIDFDPPILAIVLSNRNFSFNLLKKSKECVINIPTVEIIKQVIDCGETSGRKIDKFQKFKLTPVNAIKVKAPLIEECYACLECKVIDSKLSEKYNIFILKGLKAWINPSKSNPKTIHHEGGGTFIVATKRIKIKTRVK